MRCSQIQCDPHRSAQGDRARQMLLLTAALAVQPVATSLAAQFTVSDTSDNPTDSGSLVYAINGANASPGSTITIDNGLGTIQPTSPLPPITTSSLTLNDGTGDIIDGNLSVSGTSNLNLSNGLSYVLAGALTLVAILLYTGAAWQVTAEVVREAALRRRIRRANVGDDPE